MIQPVRIQLSRKRGFDLQAHSLALNRLPAAKVDRATGFGNPFTIERGTESSGERRQVWFVNPPGGSSCWLLYSEPEARQRAVDGFSAWLKYPRQRQFIDRAKLALRGKNLACWCKIGCACHADVLLRIANIPVAGVDHA